MVPPKLTVVPHAHEGASQQEGRAGQVPEAEARAESPDGTPAQSATQSSSEARSPAGAGDGEASTQETRRGLPPNIAQLPSADRREQLRILEALLFAAAEPLAEQYLATHLRSKDDVVALLAELEGFYASRGINLTRVAGKWAFRTAEDLAYLLERHATEARRLSKAAMETLAIIAYHQPVTRAEIEDIRGVVASAGTLDVLMQIGWVRPRGRRRAPGRPITYGTTEAFLDHFGLDAIKDLPGLAELKGSGLLDSNLPPDFTVPDPTDAAALMPDELPLSAGEEIDTPFGEDDEDEAGGA
jgi:segregation and condensation protein B